jgi:hypothetical protein
VVFLTLTFRIAVHYGRITASIGMAKVR